ncbi:MAG: 3-chlorobenzoate-3,4-dioxygenase [Planctomycetaceae bacterium]|nr:3-chlorobenzoate-3,4-dioxygenase [Planctomycetaceae bacterium]
MAKKYRVGIIGHTGRGDYGHAVDAAFRKQDNIEIVAVADANEAGRAAAQKRNGAKTAYADYRDMLAKEKLDIAAICPRWIDQHHDMLIAAAEAGCHIYMEKPFCRTLKECDAVVNALEMRHLKLGIAHISQYSPVLATVVKLIGDGVIGDLLEIRGRGKEDQRGGGEDLWVLGSHIFGMMRSIAGGSAKSCFATVTQDGLPVVKGNVKEGPEGIGLLAGDHVQASYTFAKGVTGYFASRKGMAGKPTRFAVQIFGSKGIIELESGYLVKADLLRDSSWSPARSSSKWETITSAGIGKPEPRTDGTYEGGHIAAFTDLIDSIEKDHDTKCGARDCTAIIEMIAAVFESHRVAKPVELPLKTRVNPLSLLT